MSKVKKQHVRGVKKSPSQYRVTNWEEYNKALVKRGSLTLWINEEVLADWYYTGVRKPGGEVIYSDSCIQFLLSIKSLFALPFRQVEGFARSLVLLLGLERQVAIPSYTQLCRRQKVLSVRIREEDRRRVAAGGGQLHLVVDSTGLKVYGEGEWKVRQHGVSKRRSWRKLHVMVDESTNEILAVSLSAKEVDDAEEVPELLSQIEEPVERLGGDGAYDKVKVYEVLRRRNIRPIIPPRADAVYWTDEAGNVLEHPRNDALKVIHEQGRAEWKRRSGYHRRSKAEVAMFRYKTIFGSRMYARGEASQKTEVRIKCTLLNKFTRLGMPLSVKIA